MSKLSWLLACFALANLKVLPFMFHLRFYYYVIKNFYLFKNRKRRSVFDSTRMTTLTTFLEMDFNLHKSNSTYFSDMDISRTDLMTLQLRKFFREFNDPDAPSLKRHEFIYSPLGSTQMVFRREIPAYVPYVVESRILGWTSKWLFVISVFKSQNGRTVYAFGLSKYVLKQRRKTIAPELALKFEGLLTEEAIAKNNGLQKYLQESLDLEDIINLIN